MVPRYLKLWVNRMYWLLGRGYLGVGRYWQIFLWLLWGSSGRTWLLFLILCSHDQHAFVGPVFGSVGRGLALELLKLIGFWQWRRCHQHRKHCWGWIKSLSMRWVDRLGGHWALWGCHFWGFRRSEICRFWLLFWGLYYACKEDWWHVVPLLDSSVVFDAYWFLIEFAVDGAVPVPVHFLYHFR